MKDTILVRKSFEAQEALHSFFREPTLEKLLELTASLQKWYARYLKVKSDAVTVAELQKAMEGGE